MFQLVLQFSPWDGAEFEELVDLEDRVARAIGDAGLVDGHDAGSNEANIFIHTAQPEVVFKICLGIVRQSDLADRFAAASRPLRGEKYTRLWPAKDKATFRVA